MAAANVQYFDDDSPSQPSSSNGKSHEFHSDKDLIKQGILGYFVK